MMSLLITGFEKFDGRGSNGSEEVVKRFADRVVSTGAWGKAGRIVTQVLPVTWGAVDAFEVPSDVTHWVALGEGPSYGVFVEQIALRLRRFPGIDGAEPPTLDTELPGFFRMDLKWGETQKGLVGATPSIESMGLPHGGVGIQENFFAGYYICNGIAYRAALRREQLGESRRLDVGLIHLPALEGWAARNPNGNYVNIMTMVVESILTGNEWL